ncbi:type IV secretory system conjugative DNA transfer family protein [Aquimarina sediminis]|uniref:type IV secretory system conjugative DNA transfer family protein n=1 Tax=Aquimarina sediminis TaxID=2070536 RepID=UPI000CA073C4|nr:TraM recognition domain-containing protein [Aquimarina sediminis]
MISIVLKLAKYVIYLSIIMAPIAWIGLGITHIVMYEESQWSILHQVSFMIHPVLVFIPIIKLAKRFFKSLLITSILLIIEGQAWTMLLGLEKSENAELGHQIYLAVNAFLILVSVLLFAFKRKSIREKKSEKSIANPSRILFNAKPNKVFLDNPARGIYIQGGAGSGKSESIFKPIIRKFVEQSYSGILYDFKSGELTKYLYHYINHFQSSTEAYFIDFKNPLNSNRVNPLHPAYLMKSAYAFEYAEVIINNLLPETIKERKFWDRDAQSILTGIIWYIKKHHQEYCSLPHIIALILETDTKTLLDKVSSDPETAGMVVSLRQAMQRGAEKQVAGVISTLQTALSRLNTPDIFWLLTGDDLTLDLNDPNEPKFLCIGNDSTLPSTYAPAISLIISVCTRLMNQPNKHPSALILDEAPTLYLPNIEQIPATGRSNKISTVFGVQDFSQTVEKYGQDKAQVLLSNLGNQFYGRTSNAKTAEMIKSLFSKEDKVYWAKNKNTGSSGTMLHFNTNDGQGKSQSIQERDRVKISEILKAEPGQFYGLIAEGKPREFIKYQFSYDKTEIHEDVIKTRSADQYLLDFNYSKIIQEVKSILSDEKVQSGLIDL